MAALSRVSSRFCAGERALTAAGGVKLVTSPSGVRRRARGDILTGVPVLTRLADLGDALYGTADIGLGFEVMGMPSNIMATAEGDGVGMLSGHSSQSSRNLESGDNAACAMAS